MKITIEEDNIEEAQRLLRATEAFGLLWDIDQRIRQYIKYEEGNEGCAKPEKVLDEIREMIWEDKILDLYT